ncbi:hypothetical protein PoB_003418500 [Plakobranchus ocellatus]|uniref:Uncharacterized protein n=1 Tax=Plakobranchus ocellatus TaxID=259542 RepID=A0AAV4ALD6_9GAST|nr:hypothetical protein PoB_003418500 [Plakobranchus ocellatus]
METTHVPAVAGVDCARESLPHYPHAGGVSGTVASEYALRSAGTLLSQVRAQPPAPWPDRGPKSLRSPCCGLAIHKNQSLQHAELPDSLCLPCLISWECYATN